MDDYLKMVILEQGSSENTLRQKVAKVLRASFTGETALCEYCRTFQEVNYNLYNGEWDRIISEPVRVFATTEEMKTRSSIYEMFNTNADITGKRIKWRINIPHENMKTFFEFMNSTDNVSVEFTNLTTSEVWVLCEFVKTWMQCEVPRPWIDERVEDGSNFITLMDDCAKKVSKIKIQETRKPGNNTLRTLKLTKIT
jgi:hypothetical protein